MTAPQEVTSDNTSVLPVARYDTSVLPMACLSTNQQLIRQLTFTTAAEQLTFTTATERQDEHYQAENNHTNISTVARLPGVGAPRWYNLRCIPYSTHTRPCLCNCANCLTALEMLQLGDGCSLQYRGNQAENNNTSVPSVITRMMPTPTRTSFFG